MGACPRALDGQNARTAYRLREPGKVLPILDVDRVSGSSLGVRRPRAQYSDIRARGQSAVQRREVGRSRALPGGNRPARDASDGPVAQLVEQGTFNPKVAGSIPARPIQEPPANPRSIERGCEYGLSTAA